MDDTVKLWLRVGMTLEVSPEVKNELQAGNQYILQDGLNGKIGRAYLDGETYFPDIPKNTGLQEMEFDFSGLQFSEDYEKAVAHFNREVFGKPKDLTIDGEHVRKHADELIFCHQNAKDILDFDMWTHYEELLGEPISFDEYSAIDKRFDGDILDHDKADTQTIVDLRMILEFSSAEECMEYFNTYDSQNFKSVDEMKTFQGKYGFGHEGKWYHISFDEALDVQKEFSRTNEEPER